MYLLTPEQVRFIEEKANNSGITYDMLMNNAGCEIARFITSLDVDLSKGVLFLCGNGNNAGDGFAAANAISAMSIPTYVVLVNDEPTTEQSANQYCDLSSNKTEVLFLNDNIDKVFNDISEVSVIVDAVYGIGFHGYLPPQVSACFSYASRSTAVKIAVDIPSGGDGKRGIIDPGALKCDYTITFGYKKFGMELEPLKEYCGKIFVCDIGIPAACTQHMLYPIIKSTSDIATKLLPLRPENSHKGDYGRVVNIAGSNSMPGACALSTLAALRSGVGLCTVISTKDVCSSLSANIYEPIYKSLKPDTKGQLSMANAEEILALCQKADTVMLGCGLGRGEGVTKLVKFLISNLTCPIILDADGLNAISGCIDILVNARASIIITPHPLEMARLLSVDIKDVLNDRYGYAVELQKKYKLTVVSKGVPTIIVGENGKCYLNTTGNSGLSHGGSGDVLTGIIGSFVAQGVNPTSAAVCGAYFHGLAAEKLSETMSLRGILPSDLIRILPLLL